MQDVVQPDAMTKCALRIMVSGIRHGYGNLWNQKNDHYEGQSLAINLMTADMQSSDITQRKGLLAAVF